jgi:phosphatidyl-myo-inositol alpha-mannosyltransferase
VGSTLKPGQLGGVRYDRLMRLALVTPYSWTYRGGVNRHVEALAEQFLDRGHDVRVLAPWDPPDRLSRVLHRAPAEARERPDYLVPLARTVGFSANGSVSPLCVFPDGVSRLRRELHEGGYDVVHVHEPIAPIIGWDVCSFRGAPVVGTFHAYSTRPVPNQIGNLLGARRKLNGLHARIAVSEAAAWTGRRFFGGEYRVIPNGVDLDGPPRGHKPDSEELRLLFVGRPEERKGLPVLLGAFAALSQHVPARLTLVGTSPEELEPYVADPEVGERIDALGRVRRAELWQNLHEADVLCAPSLSGESFGMVLIEAFAAGTPVVASEIAGYQDVVTDGVDGVLVPPADPQRLAEELQHMYVDPARRRRMGEAARENARRYAWPRVADELEEVYEEAQRVPEPAGRGARFARRFGLAPVTGGPRRPPRRLPSLDPAPAAAAAGSARLARRVGMGVAAVLAVGLTALAANRIGLDSVAESFVRSKPGWVLIALGLMMISMFARAGAWYAIARSALPGRRVRRRDITSGTMIGVLMSATLPARLGEPARAMVVARRIGRMRETFPVLVGTLVSQTILNVIALVILGAVIVSTTDLFHQNQKAFFLISFVPVVLLVAVVLAPSVVRQNGCGRVARAARAVRRALLQVRSGLTVFRDPRYGSFAAAAQLLAWGLQLLACFALFDALGLEFRGEVAAAAAVLFAVNVTAVVPATPSNIGVFQLAVISVLVGGFGVGAADALAYGIILQAVEIGTAVALGIPALVREGVTWRDLRLRALQTAPVRLSPVREQQVREPAAF